ncbi:hypothetical protein FXO38_33946 [Capsicum annuum]|nr:hypothetical protein FXO38_33946 [Capsicum annuum]KAF3618098.1 hypothetical protein FXO37_34349 [Capsicum annuum]
MLAGKESFIWFGSTSQVLIMDHEHIKGVLLISWKYIGYLTCTRRGVGTYEEDKWAKYGKIINPAFHLEKLKVCQLFPFRFSSFNFVIGQPKVTMFAIFSPWSINARSCFFGPKKLEKLLRKQGLKGNSYKILFRDVKDSSRMIKEATTKPMNLFDDDVAPRILPLFDEIIKKYGMFLQRNFRWLSLSGIIV